MKFFEILTNHKINYFWATPSLIDFLNKLNCDKNLINKVLPGEPMSKIQTPPLGDTPMPAKMASNTLQKNPQTNLTQTQEALLSPTEKVIASRT